MSDLNGSSYSDFDDIISNYESDFLPSDSFLDNLSNEVFENDLSFDFMEFNEQVNVDNNLENESLTKPIMQSIQSYNHIQQQEPEQPQQLQQQQSPVKRKLQFQPEQHVFKVQNQQLDQSINIQDQELPSFKQPSTPKQISINEPQITHIQSQNVFVNQQPIPSLVIPQLFYTTENLLSQQTQSPIFLKTNLIKTTEPRTVICPKNTTGNLNVGRLENKMIAPAQSTTTLLTTNIPIIIDTDKLPIINQNNDLNQSNSKGKKKSHNAIERKYRTSINDKINQLKNIVVGVNAKLNKSGILKKTIELLTTLMKNNEELRQEIAELKLQHQKFIKLMQNTHSENRMNVSDDLTPPQSETSLSPISTGQLSIPPSPDVCLNNTLQTSGLTEDLKLADDKYLHELMLKGMGDHSRLALCMFLFGTFSMNPINVLYNLFTSGKQTDDSSTIFNGRTILGQRTDSYQETNWLNFSYSYLTIGFFNFLMFFICFLKFFVFYDYPNLSIKSKQGNNFWMHRKQAEFDISKGQMDSAEIELKRCLNVYSFSLPVSKLDLIFNVACQIIRQILHRLWIGRFISRFAGGIFVNKNKRYEVLNSRKELAMNFHYLSQIHLIKNSKAKLEKLYGLMLALNAVNLAESSGTLISPENLVDIYAGLILRIRTFIPSWLRITRRLYFELARRVQLNSFNEMPARTRWIFSKYGSKFFLSRGRVDYYNANISDTNMFCSLEDASNPMCYVLKVYKEHLMRKAMQILLSPGQKLEMCENKPKNVKCTQIPDALYFVKLLMETVYSSNDVSVWWINLMTISTYWHLNEDSKAEQLFDKIKLMPKFLENSNDPLPKSIHTIFKARVLFPNLKNCKIAEKDILKLCDEATKFLEESLALGSCKKQNFLIYYFQLLACDWILETRMNLWEDNNENGTQLSVNSKYSLSGFQKSLSCLRILTQYLPAATSRIFLYEAIARLMAGAAPGRTQLLLDRSLKNRHAHSSLICGKDNNDAGGEKQHAQALYVACKYLPGQMLSIPGERAGMLTESINLLERIGEKKQCLKNYQFIKNF